MATLYDLAMQYLNQSLPKTFKYDRTPPIGTNPPGLFPQPPVKPIEKLLPRPGGNEEGFSVYNPDPNRTRNESNYNARAYMKANPSEFFDLNNPNEMSGLDPKQLEGIPGMIQGYIKNSIPGQLIGNVVGGINNLLPVNRRAIYENELLGQGIALDDIGRIVSDGGNINTAENIMAGYNANKVTAETFQKRRDMINAKMSDKVNPKTGKTFKQEKLDALDGAEAKMLGTAKTRADTVFDAKSLEKDPTYKNFDQRVTEGLLAGDEGDDLSEIPQDKLADIYPQSFKADTFDDKVGSSNQFTYPIGPDGLEMDNVRTIVRNPNYSGNVDIPFGGTVLEDEEEYLDYTSPNIYNTKSIYTSVPTSTYDEAGIELGGDGTGSVGSVDPAGINSIDSTVYANENNPNSVSTSGLTYNQGGGQGGSYDEAGVNEGRNYNAGRAAENAQRAAIRDAAKTGMTVNQAKASVGMPANLGDTGGGDNQSNAGKIVCTMMNESYGFGSFRNKIWLKHSKGLAPEYQKGYHKLFLPLVKIAKTNKVVRKILEHIAVHRTIDIRQESRGKVHLLGRVYRKILEPLCYIVGKHG